MNQPTSTTYRAVYPKDPAVCATVASPPLLNVADVMERYGFRDARAAREVMRDAGCIRVRGRLFIKSANLAAWEDSHKVDTGAERIKHPSVTRNSRTAPESDPPLAPGWWSE